MFKNFQSYKQFDLLRNEGFYQGPGPHEIAFILPFVAFKKMFFFCYCFGQRRKNGLCGGCALRFVPGRKMNLFTCFRFQADTAWFCFSLVFIVITWVRTPFVSFWRGNTNKYEINMERPWPHIHQRCGRLLTNFFFHFKSYCLLFWARLVLRSWLVLRMRPPFASLATRLR